jgi:hypothetical protein
MTDGCSGHRMLLKPERRARSHACVFGGPTATPAVSPLDAHRPSPHPPTGTQVPSASTALSRPLSHTSTRPLTKPLIHRFWLRCVESLITPVARYWLLATQPYPFFFSLPSPPRSCPVSQLLWRLPVSITPHHTHHTSLRHPLVHHRFRIITPV